MRKTQIKCSNNQTMYRQGMCISLSTLKASLPHLCFNLLLSLPESSFVPSVFVFFPLHLNCILILILLCLSQHIIALSTLLPHNSAFSISPCSSTQFLALRSSLCSLLLPFLAVSSQTRVCSRDALL